MLLRQLAEHAATRKDLPPPFYRERTVRWAITIDQAGKPTHDELESLVTDEHQSGIVLPTPYIYRSGQKPPPFLLVDSLRYVLAMPQDDTEKEEQEAIRRNDAYVELVDRWHATATDDPRVKAVQRFFASGAHLEIGATDDAKPTDVVAVRLAGDGEWAHSYPSAIAFWQDVVRERKSAGAIEGVCLSCNQQKPLLDTIPESIKSGAIPVANGRARDAQLVSINKAAQGRGGTIQLANTPLCGECGGSAMSALNALLADRRHRYRGADSVLVWWLREAVDFDFFKALTQADAGDVQALFRELQRAQSDPAHWVNTDQFYSLTLSANQSRVVIRDWIDVSLREVFEHIRAWFADHAMADLWKDGPQWLPMWRLVQALGRWSGDAYVSGTAPHNAERDLLASALRGSEHRPPAYILQRLIQRIAADQHVDLSRAALLRLLLTRRNHNRGETPVDTLDATSTDPAYLSGRLFAVLESIQREALYDRKAKRGPNTTIADKFFSAAMASPLAVLTMLRKNATGHLKRLRRDNPGACVALTNRLDDLYDPVRLPLPRTLNLEGQGWFVLGYHHQRAEDRAAARANSKKTTERPADE